MVKKLKALKQLNKEDGKFAKVNALEITNTIRVIFFLALLSFRFLNLTAIVLDDSESIFVAPFVSVDSLINLQFNY